MTKHLIVSRSTHDPHGRHNLHTRLWDRAGVAIALVVVALALVTVAGCGGTGGPSAGNGSSSTGTTPGVVNTPTPRSLSAPSAITELPLPASIISSSPVGITNGPDGALWFTETDANQIGHITPGK